jgi:hypothetical protein
MGCKIQVWATFGPTDITTDISSNRFRIEVKEPNTEIPNGLERSVEDSWTKAQLKRKIELTDNPVLYLSAPMLEDKGKITLPTEVRGFRYTHALNRDPCFWACTELLKQYKLLSLSTHCHLVSKDGKILFGIKKNQFNQISGFSGFPNAEEDVIELEGRKYLDIYKTIQKRLYSEIGYLVNAFDAIKAVGLVYVGQVSLRGLDSDYVIELDETSWNMQKRFSESAQFEKEIFAVDFEPRKIKGFFKEMHSKGRQISNYALGCSYAIFKGYFGEDEANKLLKTIREEIGITISTSNETDYLRN